MRYVILATLMSVTMSGCAGQSSYWDNGLAMTQMECSLKGGSPEDCALLPEYGFGDWEKWSEGLAAATPVVPSLP